MVFLIQTGAEQGESGDTAEAERTRLPRCEGPAID
jgi:hypothetical protein